METISGRPYEGVRIVAKITDDPGEYPGLREEQIAYCIDYIAEKTIKHLRDKYPGAEVDCAVSGHSGYLLQPRISYLKPDSETGDAMNEEFDRGENLAEQIRCELNEKRPDWLAEAIEQPDFPDSP